MFFDKNKGYIKNYKYNKNDLLKEVYPNGNNNKEIYKCNPKYYVNTIQNTSLLYIYFLTIPSIHVIALINQFHLIHVIKEH